MLNERILSLAHELTLSNGMSFKVAAILMRRGKLVGIGVCSMKTSPHGNRLSRTGNRVSQQHAEIHLLRHVVAHRYKPNDTLYVVRFLADGQMSMAMPCPACAHEIGLAGLRKVFFTNWQGQFERLRI